jgi:hypothetical protein
MHTIRMITALGLLGAIGFAAWRGPKTTQARQAPAEAFSRAELRMQARWAGQPDPIGGPSALLGFPDRATWDACRATQGSRDMAPGLDMDCSSVVRAMIAFPPIDGRTGRALVSELGAQRFLEGPPHRAPVVVSWSANIPIRFLDRDNLLVLAAATATLLGSEVVASNDDPILPGPDDAVAGLSRLRAAMRESCMDCAPPPAPLPAPRMPDVSAILAGERMVRAELVVPDVAAPLGAIVAASRGTGRHPTGTWMTPGLAGLAALELARVRDPAAIPHLLAQGVRGPEAADRVAALYAAATLMRAPGEAARWAKLAPCVSIADCPEGAGRLVRVLAALHGS